MNPQKTYRPDGSLWHEEWYDKEGDLHREDGPASIYYREDSAIIKREYWYKHGECHRLDGPATILYDKNGSIREEYWYVYDVLLTKDQVLAHKRNLIINKLIR